MLQVHFPVSFHWKLSLMNKFHAECSQLESHLNFVCYVNWPRNAVNTVSINLSCLIVSSLEGITEPFPLAFNLNFVIWENIKRHFASNCLPQLRHSIMLCVCVSSYNFHWKHDWFEYKSDLTFMLDDLDISQVVEIYWMRWGWENRKCVSTWRCGGWERESLTAIIYQHYRCQAGMISRVNLAF